MKLEEMSKEELIQQIYKLKDKNQRKTTALLDISNDMIKRAKAGKKRVKEKKIQERSPDEMWKYYNDLEKTWERRKQSYLFL